MHDVGDVLVLVATLFEHGRNAGKIGDGIQILRRLLCAVATVEVGADAAVQRIASKLADVVNVVADDFKLEAGFLRGGFATNPARDHHPRIQGSADDTAA